MRAATAIVLAWLAVAPQLGAASAIGSLELLGLATIPPGTRFADAEVGGLSGITYDPQRDRYYAISDDSGYRSQSRFYTLKIDLRSGPPEVAIDGVAIFTDRKGRVFEEGVIDGEGIALTPRRTLLISSEGYVERGVPPSIREVDLDGREIRRYRIPRRWLPKKRRPQGVRHNQAFESLAALPGGRGFVTATENALFQDGPETDVGQGSRTRISRFNSRSGKLEASFVYEVEPVHAPPTPDDGFRTNGLVELLALGDTTLLALERSFSLGVGNSIRLFLVSTAGADDVRRIASLERIGDVEPVSKRLLIDLADLDLELDNVEGMTFGPTLADGRRSLILVSDDNFSSRQTTQLFAFAVEAGATPPPAIQGREHRSPLEGRWLAEVRGVVTAVDREGRRPGFWIQDPAGDGDEATSDGLFVSAAGLERTVGVGDLVAAGGRVVESGRPGELPVTRLVAHRLEVSARGTPLPAAVRLGPGGHRVPATVDDDGLASFDPETDAIDFYESLEGMRVEIGSATVSGPTTGFGTLTLAIDGGAGARTARGGLLLTADDPNAERLTIDGSLTGGAPEVEVGQRLAAPLAGVLDYAFGGYRLLATHEPHFTAAPSPAARGGATAAAPGRFTVATYNVWNLDPTDAPERFSALGGQLAAARPDLVALQEIQDDSGPLDDGAVAATATLAKLVEAVRAQGGPSYAFAQIDPENNADGGAPGGNIRVAFLYDRARVSLVTSGSKLGADNPRRLFESSPAFRADAATGFEATRKPLAAEFELDGRRIVAINVHLKSKRGDDAVFGARQPPEPRTEPQRAAQAGELGGFAGSLMASDPEALLLVLGDFNEHEFRPPMRLLAESGLINLVERVAQPERYTYNFEGNSQAIDHILVSPALAELCSAVEILHLNADYPSSRRSSDHDAVLARFEIALR